jgi:hypothetical protein
MRRAPRAAVRRRLLTRARRARVRRRLHDRTDSALALEAREIDLRAALEQKTRRLDSLHEGVAACELRLALLRECLADSAPRLEALRAEGGVAEERHRVKAIQLGLLNERLRERKQQLQQLQRYTLEQRVRVGSAQWARRHACDAAVAGWRAGIALQIAARERKARAASAWRVLVLKRSLSAWRDRRLGHSDDRQDHEEQGDWRQRALETLERATSSPTPLA